MGENFKLWSIVRFKKIIFSNLKHIICIQQNVDRRSCGLIFNRL